MGLRTVGLFMLPVLLVGMLPGQAPAAPKVPEPAPAALPVLPPPPEWLRSELIFSLQRKDASGLSSSEWRLFYDEVILPRFSQNVFLIEGSGSLKARDGSLGNGPVNILIFAHTNTSKNNEMLKAVAAEYKKRYQLPVIIVATPAEVKMF